MADHDDDLQALRAADPLDRASVTSSSDPRARSLFERITMTDTATSPAPAPPDPARPRRWRVALAAAAVAAVALIGGVVALAGDDADELDQSAATTQPDPGASPGGPIDPGGTSMSCVEVYDLTTLAAREVAFAGTVQSVDDDVVTFAVDEWYRGGDAAEVSLQGALGLSSFTSAGDTVELETGTRMLVAGDGGFAWSCGFTQPYDEAVAQQWAEALRG